MAGYSVCLIGNSHLAALAQAWRKDRMGARPGVSLVYFGMRGGHDWELALQDSTLTPKDDEGKASFQRSSRGRSVIALREYDAFVIYGLGFRVSNLLPLFLDHGTLEDREWGPVGQLISQDCLAAALRGGLSAATGLKVLEQIRSVCQAPAVVSPMPFRSESGFSHSFISRHPRLSQPEYLARVEKEFRLAAVSLCAGRAADFVAQDESTWAMPCFTREEFVLGGTNWRAE